MTVKTPAVRRDRQQRRELGVQQSGREKMTDSRQWFRAQNFALVRQQDRQGWLLVIMLAAIVSVWIFGWLAA